MNKHLQIIEALNSKVKKNFVIEEFCFEEQKTFINDKSKFSTACCSRRAGKTVACAADLVNQAITCPGRANWYITLSRKNAKKIIWPDLLRINRDYKLQGIPNDTDLSIKFPNGSVIYLSGAKDKSEIENFRGIAMNRCYIDEAQSFRDYLSDMIDDVIAKTLYDYDGELRVIGTPGPVPAGYFFEMCHNQTWAHHAWTMFQNPWIKIKSGKTPMELTLEDCKRRGVTIDHPSIQRENFGKWVVDTNSLVFRYDKTINDFTEIPEVAGKWEYVIGIDVGFEDADALAVIGWNEKIKEAYLVEEIVKAKQGITELAMLTEGLIGKYKPLRIVMDTGGLGKKIAEEIQKRYSLPIQPAEKARKFEFIELLNDALRTKRFYARAQGSFAQDSMLVEWDKEANKLKISESFHSDICDAVLYAFRESLHWLYTPETPKPKVGTQEWFKKEEEMMENVLIEQLNKEKEDEIWGDYWE